MTLSPLARLQDLPPAEAAPDGDFFLSRAWFAHLAENAFAPARQVRLYGWPANGASRWLAMCHGARAPFGARRLSALSNWYTPRFGLIGGAAGVPPLPFDALEEALAAIARERPRWDIVELHPLAREEAQAPELARAFRAADMLVQPYFCFGNWYLPVAGRSFQAYFDSRPSRLRHTVQRKTRQLQQDERLQIEIVRGGAALEAAIASYETVYRASWKQPEPSPSFIPGLIRLCARQGSLRLGLLHIDGRPAAAQLWIVQGGVASIYKLAYDAQFTKWSAGSMLTAALMREAIDVDRVQEIDYLSGDDAYKREWMSHRRERWGVMAFNLHTLRGLLAALRHLGGRALKRRLG